MNKLATNSHLKWMKTFWKTNNPAGGNKQTSRMKYTCRGNFFSKSINVQTKIRPCKGEFFLKIVKHACTSIRYTRVHSDFGLLSLLELVWMIEYYSKHLLSANHKTIRRDSLELYCRVYEMAKQV